MKLSSIEYPSNEMSREDVTLARITQIDFISQHLQSRVDELATNPDFNDGISNKIYRCHIANYVKDNLFGKLSAKQVAAAIKRTNRLQVESDMASFLPYTDQFKLHLKELLISSLFASAKQRKNDRARMVYYKDQLIDVKELIQLPDFQFLDDLIDISYLMGASDCGNSTFNETQFGQQLRQIPPKAGSLNISEVQFHPQSENRISDFFDYGFNVDSPCSEEDQATLEVNYSPFTICNDDDYKFAVFFPNEEQSECIVLITNEEKKHSLDQIKQKLPTVKKYDCFSEAQVYVVNLKNGTERESGASPVEVFSYVDGELSELKLYGSKACCLLDFSGVSRNVERTFSLEQGHNIDCNNDLGEDEYNE
ncbi:hypothetical protein [Photobacterium damselae]|uniref:hypothetical protein n=1 Tax=Photobacterium damselae TaxID=38293 RepID=UPI00406840B1